MDFKGRRASEGLRNTTVACQSLHVVGEKYIFGCSERILTDR